MRGKEHDLNQAAFRRMEEHIKNTYPRGHFVAIGGGEIVADADAFDTLYSMLKESGRNPVETLIIQAGHVYPEKAIILLDGTKS